MLCRRYLIRGAVQGVGYRAFAQHAAQQLSLTGWVRNLSDGGVELLACGRSAELGRLERRLRAGPPTAHVEQLIVSDSELRSFPGFEVVS